MTIRIRLVAVAVVFVGLAGACGGGGGTTTTHAPPAAKIDPNANGTLTGPINQARTQASNENARTQQLEQQTGG